MSQLKPIATLVAGLAAIASVAAFAPVPSAHAKTTAHTSSVVRPNPTCPPYISPMHGEFSVIHCPG